MGTDKRDRVIFIVGPTATGKTKTAVELAKKINGEIISCDSMQIYKSMPVLTQAPSKEDRKEVTHHLIAESSPEREYNAAQFSKKATALIRDIIKKGKMPIIVGGTGLYVKAIIDGLFPSPKKDLKLRRRLESKAKKYGSISIYDELKKIDPEAADKIHPNDIKRIIRALELYYLTGVPVSIHKRNTKGIKDDYEILEAGLDVERKTLYEKINKRVEGMFKTGLITEVKGLLRHKLSITAQQAIGIKEIKAYLNGECNLEQAKELIKRNTRRYAKRQWTWFRQDKRIKWFSDGKSLISYCKSWA